MNDLTVRVEGGDALERDLAKRELAMLRSADQAMARLAELAADRMRTSMKSASSPSSPGSPPGIVSGNLIKGVYSAHQPGTLRAVAGIDAPHWHFAEFGTVKMAARPVIRPAGKSVAMDAARILKDASRSDFGGS